MLRANCTSFCHITSLTLSKYQYAKFALAIHSQLQIERKMKIYTMQVIFRKLFVHFFSEKEGKHPCRQGSR
jgi:hypothetical protein